MWYHSVNSRPFSSRTLRGGGDVARIQRIQVKPKMIDLVILEAKALTEIHHHSPETTPWLIWQCGMVQYPVGNGRTSREHSCHEWVHLVSKDVQIPDSCQELCYSDNGAENVPRKHHPQYNRLFCPEMHPGAIDSIGNLRSAVNVRYQE